MNALIKAIVPPRRFATAFFHSIGAALILSTTAFSVFGAAPASTPPPQAGLSSDTPRREAVKNNFSIKFSTTDTSIEAGNVRSMWKTIERGVHQAVGDGDMQQNLIVEPVSGKKSVGAFRVSPTPAGVKLILSRDLSKWGFDTKIRRSLIALILGLKSGASLDANLPKEATWIIDAIDRRIERLLSRDRPVPFGGSFPGARTILMAGGGITVEDVVDGEFSPEDGLPHRIHAEKCELLFEAVTSQKTGRQALLEYLKLLCAGGSQEGAMHKLCETLYADNANLSPRMKAIVGTASATKTGKAALSESERLQELLDSTSWRLSVNSLCPLNADASKRLLQSVLTDNVRFAVKEAGEKKDKETIDKKITISPKDAVISTKQDVYDECALDKAGEKLGKMKRPDDVAMECKSRVLKLFDRMPHFLREPVEDIGEAFDLLRGNGDAAKFKLKLEEARKRFDDAAAVQKEVESYLREQELKHTPPGVLHQPFMKALKELEASKTFTWPAIEDYTDKTAGK